MTAPTFFWFRLRRAGCWHVWAVGGESSLCGMVAAATVRRIGATTSVHLTPTTPAESERRCQRCWRRRYGGAPPVVGGGVIRTWAGVLAITCRRLHLRVRAADVKAFAALLDHVGSPPAPDAQTVYRHVQPIILHAVRRGRVVTTAVRSVLPLITSAAALRHIATAVATWATATGRCAMTERFHPVSVVTAMLAVPEHGLALYVARLHGRGVVALAQMFHPHTITRARHDVALRGVWQGSAAYWQATRHDLHVVTD